MKDYTDRFQDWDAAYLLGALDPEERRAFERHLATCPDCATAVFELAGLPGLLGRLPADEAIALATGPGEGYSAENGVGAHSSRPSAVQRLAITAARKRRRSRRRRTGAFVGAGAVLVAGGVLLGIAIAPPADRVPTVATSDTVFVMEPVDSGPGASTGAVSADLRVTEKGWGTRFDWTCEYAYPGGNVAAARSYELVITDETGTESVVASWTAGSTRSGDLAASSRVPTSDIDSIEIRSTRSDVPLARTTL